MGCNFMASAIDPLIFNFLIRKACCATGKVKNSRRVMVQSQRPAQRPATKERMNTPLPPLCQLTRTWGPIFPVTNLRKSPSAKSEFKQLTCDTEVPVPPLAYPASHLGLPHATP
jgi:hypothetical protein